MLFGDLGPVLVQLRLARSGTFPGRKVPEPLSQYLGHGLGRLCDLLADWIEEDTADRRAVDATLRFYGLSRMPEPLVTIAASLRGHNRPAGVNPRRVQQMIAKVVNRTEKREAPIGIEARPCEGPWPPSDPFALPLSNRQRRQLFKVLLWAWADAIDPPSPDGRALLLCEFEHGLRPRGPEWRHRPERQRLLHRAWSMLEVAKYRRDEAAPDIRLTDRSLGPRYLALVDWLPDDQVRALMELSRNPLSGDVRVALQGVRAAVRASYPEAPELLGLFRDAVSQLRRLPVDVTSQVLMLSAMVARERRDPMGFVAGEQALVHAGDVMNGRTVRQARADSELEVVSNALKAVQESAALSYWLGDFDSALRTIRTANEALRTFGDPERDTEPEGWRQQYVLFESSLSRHIALRSRVGDKWMSHAERGLTVASDLVFEGDELPRPWGFSAQEQRVGLLLDRAEIALLNNDREAAHRLVGRGARLREELEDNWAAVARSHPEGQRLNQARGGLLAVARTGWRAALLMGDREWADAARAVAWSRTGQWTTPTQIDKMLDLERASLRLGLKPKDRPQDKPLYRDRATLMLAV